MFLLKMHILLLDCHGIFGFCFEVGSQISLPGLQLAVIHKHVPTYLVYAVMMSEPGTSCVLSTVTLHCQPRT